MPVPHDYRSPGCVGDIELITTPERVGNVRRNLVLILFRARPGRCSYVERRARSNRDVLITADARAPPASAFSSRRGGRRQDTRSPHTCNGASPERSSRNPPKHSATLVHKWYNSPSCYSAPHLVKSNTPARQSLYKLVSPTSRLELGE